jgi:hypothetical protein
VSIRDSVPIRSSFDFLKSLSVITLTALSSFFVCFFTCRALRATGSFSLLFLFRSRDAELWLEEPDVLLEEPALELVELLLLELELDPELKLGSDSIATLGSSTSIT